MLIDRKDTEKADKGGIPLDAKAGNTLPPSQKQWRKGESRSWAPLKELPNFSFGIFTLLSSKPGNLVSRFIYNTVETGNHKGMKLLQAGKQWEGKIIT